LPGKNDVDIYNNAFGVISFLKRNRFHTFFENNTSNMKATGQKLKKLKTRQVYGFKKHTLYVDNTNIDPTTITIIAVTHMV